MNQKISGYEVWFQTKEERKKVRKRKKIYSILNRARCLTVEIGSLVVLHDCGFQ